MYSRQLLPLAPEVLTRTRPSLPISISRSWGSMRLLLIAPYVEPDGSVHGFFLGHRREPVLSEFLREAPIHILPDHPAGQLLPHLLQLLLGEIPLDASAEAAAGVAREAHLDALPLHHDLLVGRERVRDHVRILHRQVD